MFPETLNAQPQRAHRGLNKSLTFSLLGAIFWLCDAVFRAVIVFKDYMSCVDAAVMVWDFPHYRGICGCLKSHAHFFFFTQLCHSCVSF